MSEKSSAGKAKFSAVTFDLDGTLYPDSRLFFKLTPFVIKNWRLLRAMGAARKHLRKTGEYHGNFYELQAKIMGEILGEDAETIREKTDRLIYRGWEPFFHDMRLFRHLVETLDAFKAKGIRMGILSDFPPVTKLKNMKIEGYWDVALCSEESGRLKPDPLSFLEMADKMGKKPEEMLYVGNKIRYDVDGAIAAGMKAALILPKWRKPPADVAKRAFVFYDYRNLRDYVLQ